MDANGLGRGVVVASGAVAPAPFAGRPRVIVDDAADPDPVRLLHTAWLAREPVVVDLRIGADELREEQTDIREPWEVGDRFEFARDRLHFLVWANNFDARREEPVWWWGRKASRLGAAEGGPADIVLRDGTSAYVDGGPRSTSRALVHFDAVEMGALRLQRRGDPPAGLAPDQTAAVTHDAGPARIIAPAGSGKTRVLTERLRFLIDGCGWEAQAITAVAFNKRAADELIERTAGLHAHVRTINALGLAVLTGALGGPAPSTRPRVIDEPEVRRILDSLVDVRHQANTDVLAPYLEALSAIRIGLRAPDEVEAALPDAVGLASVWPAYQDTLRARGLIDFDDQIDRAIRVLLTQPEVRAAAQRRCRHLLVDEFQDLAPAHLLLLRLLAAPGYDVFGVGDDDQVIYGYAGATPSYLIDFEKWFPGATAHALEVNYRCPTAVVAGARQLLSYNDTRIVKEIRAADGAAAGKLAVRRVRAATMAEEMLAEVRSALAAGRTPDEIAVLSRVNSALLPVQVALGVAGIKTNVPLDRRVLDRTGVRTALAWLRIGIDPSHIGRADVTDTIRRPSRRISRNVAEMLTKRPRTSVADIRRLAGRLTGGDGDKLLGYAADIEAVHRAAARGTAAALAAIRTQIGLGQAMDSLDASRSEADRSSHGDDLRALEMVAALHDDAATFADWLASELDHTVDEDGPLVTLSTVHRVKGQEWPIVIVFGAHAEAFPHRLATDVEEERRVFHVAITRASAEALVLADAQEPSPFVAELTSAREKVPVRGRVTRVPTVAAAPAASPADEGTWEALRAWRRETAQRTSVPAYVVLSDVDLRGIAERRPATIEDLRRCRGMGPTRLERYGDEILAVLEASSG